MDVLHLTVPGRFPTVVHDPGLWWDTLASEGRHRVARFSLNYHWWRAVCSKAAVPALLKPLPRLDRWRQKLTWASQGLDVAGRAAAAGQSLDALQTREPYRRQQNYLDALKPFAQYLETINAIQDEMTVRVDSGAWVKHLNYADSQALARYATRDTFLRRTIELALTQLTGRPRLVALSVTSPEDLLTALITAAALHARLPGAHVCLVDHGYENFSLHVYMERLKETGVFGAFFDSIVTSKDERDEIVPALADRLERGEQVPAFLAKDAIPPHTPIAGSAAVPPPTLSVFAPDTILWTRLSKRRCYWSRCTYCTQNSKYADERAPTRSEILKTLDRLEGFVRSGCNHFIFSDEALSPSTLRLLAREIEARKLRFHWACRCKIERAHDAELFEALGRAGCYEILYGLETTSARVLKLMDKHVEGIDEPHLARVFREMDAAGIGVHVNLIGGYPGDTAADTRASVDFLVRELPVLRGATYVLNSFALLPDTPMARAPTQYGIARVAMKGDLDQVLDFELQPDLTSCTAQAADMVPGLREHLDHELGWDRLASGAAGSLAQILYFGSGHGAIFKSVPDNPFAQARHR